MKKTTRRPKTQTGGTKRPKRQVLIPTPAPQALAQGNDAKRRVPGDHAANDRPAPCERPPVPAGHGCEFSFNIHADGDIHIHNVCSDSGAQPERPAGGEAGGDCHAGSETCVPVVAGHKHKQGRSQKIAERASWHGIPSVLASSTIHAIRRYASGASPANALEQQMFSTLAKMPKSFLQCTVDGFDSIPPDQRAKVFAASPSGTDAWDVNQLADAFTREIKQRTALAMLGDAAAADGERPGQNRLYVPSGEDFNNQVRICRVNQLRTSGYVPVVPPASRIPAEYQQDCQITVVNGVPEQYCELRTGNCPGNIIDNVCGRVIDAAQGDTVELEGVNFFEVEAKVRLRPKDESAAARDIDAFVFGDVDTPLDEVIGTETVPIRDCRVRDRITFQIPNDLPANLYQMEVVIQNNLGNPVFGSELVSNVEFLNVLPAPGAKYQVMIKRVKAVEETWPTSWGSDEVGLRTVAAAIDLAGNLMDPQKAKFVELDGYEFDSGSKVDTNRVVFENDAPFSRVIIAVMGHEIDSEWAYNRQVDEWSDYFIHLLDTQKEFLLALIGSGGIGGLKWLGWKGLLYGLLAAGVVVALDALLALWGPADPIMDDIIDLSVIDLDQLVSPATPVPLSASYASQLHLRVNVRPGPPPPKLPFQYTEVREYLSAPELSKYELTFQYNRLL